MRYIRTKNGNVYKIVGKSGLGYFVSCSSLDYNNVMNIYSGDIEKEADNIEELCDKFVLVDKNEYERFVEQEFVESKYRIMVEYNLRLYTGSDRSKMDVYGAAWTERGLIYVAKMNEKKEFELL